MALIGILFVALVQLVLFAGLVFLWMRMKRNMEDDTRLSRGLQFLQNKIAVFEDLSDRTEHQVKQLTVMMENKICDLQRKIDEADEVLNKISSSMKKSIEVAQIFQDRIPHEEIIERQNKVKFVKAALLANEGKSEDEIAEVIDLPKSQIEFIVKVNSDRLSFDAAQMPEWLKSELNKDPSTKHSLFEKKKLESLSDSLQVRSPLRPLEQIMKQRAMPNDFETISPKTVELSETGLNSVNESTVVPSSAAANQTSSANPILPKSSAPIASPSSINSSEVKAANLAQGALSRKAKDMGIRPVVFPRIEMPR